jgi:heme/copper-type cytochrome/quinol oxidase subunit 3
MTILASIWGYSLARDFKEKDKQVYLKYALLTTLLLGVMFIIFQLLGWQRIFHDMKAHNVKILMVLVLVHGFHFLIALGLAISLIVKVSGIKSATDNYIFFLNPRHNLFFKTTGYYWDFLGFLWMGLYIIMLLKTI